jgi:preprotein translocase subunit SecA
MIGSIIKKVFGDKASRDLKEMQPYADQVKAVYPQLQSLSNDELRAKSVEFKQRIAAKIADEQGRTDTLRQETEDDPKMAIAEREGRYQEIDKLEEKILVLIEEVLMELLPEAFAVMKETARRFNDNKELTVTAQELDREIAAKRDNVRIEGDKAIWKNSWDAAGTPITWDMVHYDVQLIGGAALHKGKIAEMSTGEGKTLVATLPMYLNALTGSRCAPCDGERLPRQARQRMDGALVRIPRAARGLHRQARTQQPARRQAYLADITFGTNNEFGFDYLRDNMAHAPTALVQRKHHFAIIDEVDSVLVDDARTPLIISGPTPKGEIHQFDEYKPRVEKLYNAQRSLVNKLIAEAKELLKDGGKKDQAEKAGLGAAPRPPWPAEIRRVDQIPQRTRRAFAAAKDREPLLAGPAKGNALRRSGDLLHHRREAAQHRDDREGSRPHQRRCGRSAVLHPHRCGRRHCGDREKVAAR